MSEKNPIRKPEWLKVSINGTGYSAETEKLLKDLGLHTVCEEANCPNKGECYSNKTATFMILGNVCTRNCTFCNVTKGHPLQVDQQEPQKVASAVQQMQIKHVVITSVSRDDLPDGGAGHFADVINAIKNTSPEVSVEVLIPDFIGDIESLKTVVKAAPQIINHNIETVPSLYQTVRSMAVYDRSLKVLKRIKDFDPKIYTKSGIMLGLGEAKREVLEVLKDLLEVGCDFITIGQYLRPSLMHHEVKQYIHPDVFNDYGNIAREMGFKYVVSGPLVRSSYHAQDFLIGAEEK